MTVTPSPPMTPTACGPQATWRWGRTGCRAAAAGLWAAGVLLVSAGAHGPVHAQAQAQAQRPANTSRSLRGSPRPVAARLYATVTPVCAPWDGPAQRVVIFTGTGGGCGEREIGVDRLALTLWRQALPLRAPLAIWLTGELGDGMALHCTARQRCAPLPPAHVELDEVGDHVLGRLRYTTPAGDRVDLPFRAERCPAPPPPCG